MANIDVLNNEIQWRKDLLNELGGQTVNTGIEPAFLRDWNIYGGAQGIWVDKKRTESISEDGNGFAVSLLHKGTIYPDDFDSTGVIYHYPSTNRPQSRDLSEIEAVKNCSKFGVPLFVITVSQDENKKRDVYFGFVTMWDDQAKVFIIEFGLDKPSELIQDFENPFELYLKESKETYEAPKRPTQAAFRIAVFKRYGAKCTVCDISVVDLLDAAHLAPKSEDGTDDPRNGIPFCALHHRAFDKGLFVIHPKLKTIIYKDNGPKSKDLGITKDDINHLKDKPHDTALLYCWDKWNKENA